MGCFDTQKEKEGNTYWATLSGIRDKRGQRQKAESGDSRYMGGGGEEVSCGVLAFGGGVAAIPFLCSGVQST